MPISSRPWRAASLILCLTVFSSCWIDSDETPDLDVSLSSGVDAVIRIDDTEADVAQRSAWQCDREVVSDGSTLGELKFSHVCHYKDLGIRAYYRYNRVALIEIQEPFHGMIKGRNLKLFGLTRVPGKAWRDTLIQSFGAPATESDGGRLSSQALFYYWGDIAFNGQGPNELAIYRDVAIRSYRSQNFGRILDLGFH